MKMGVKTFDTNMVRDLYRLIFKHRIKSFSMISRHQDHCELACSYLEGSSQGTDSIEHIEISTCQAPLLHYTPNLFLSSSISQISSFNCQNLTCLHFHQNFKTPEKDYDQSTDAGCGMEGNDERSYWGRVRRVTAQTPFVKFRQAKGRNESKREQDKYDFELRH